MISALRHRAWARDLQNWLVVFAVLAAAVILGVQASSMWLGVLASILGGVVLLAQPLWGLLALVIAALVLPLEVSTGTEVTLNLATLLLPALLVLWLLGMLRQRHIGLVPSRTTLPLALFLAAGLLSLLIGNAMWDPTVLRKANFLLVQIGQWGIFAFSASAFWLAANLIKDEASLRRMTAVFLFVGGGLAVLTVIPGVDSFAGRVTTVAFIRAPFWMLLAGLAAGQLLFNRQLALVWRAFLAAVLTVTLVYTFVEQQEAVSNWVGVGVVLAMLGWLRFPRLRWPAVVAVLILGATGALFATVYEFAGGDEEWTLSGAARLALIQRVVEVTLRNPITGLGPAAYRPYANMEPLAYGRALWYAPSVNSHNNYVDLFAHGGLLGLALFGWFLVETLFLGLRLRRRHASGFTAGYVNGMLATWVGALAIMMLADWILPFVYNIGFPGFQASVLVWLFLGGLVAVEHMGGGGETKG